MVTAELTVLRDVSTTMPLWKYASAAALTIMVWEMMRAFDDEVEFIWKRRTAPIIVKVLYLFLRYFGLAAVIVNHLLVLEVESKYPLTDVLCMRLRAFQAFSVRLLLASVEFILMIRVYALHDRSLVVGVVLLLVFGFESLVSAILSVRVHRVLLLDSMCHVQDQPHEAIYIGGVAVNTQLVTWAMMMTGREKVVRREPWPRRKVPLLSLIVRDGAIAFLAISAIILGTPIYASISSAFYNFAPAWIMSTLSIAGCRLVINVQQFATLEPSNASSIVVFTTLVDEDQEPASSYINS